MIVEPFTCVAEGLTLRGTVSRPAGSGPFPGVVLQHGFSGQRMENGRLFVDLARRLAAEGFAVLAWDRAGHGESDGEFFDTSIVRDVRHAQEVLAAFGARADVDAEDLHLVGYSLGAVVSITTAAAGTCPVRSVVLWSSASIVAEDVKSGHVLGKPISQLDEQGFIDMNGQRLGPAIVEHALAFDPYEAAAPYAGPVLLVHGTADFVPTRCAARYAEVLADAQVDLVQDADHGWSTVPHRDHLLTVTTSHVTRHRRRPRRPCPRHQGLLDHDPRHHADGSDADGRGARRRCARRLDVRRAHGQATCRRGTRPAGTGPLGPANDRDAAAGGGRPR